MNPGAIHQRTCALLFLCIALGVYATALAVVRRLPHLESAGALAVGLTVDMVVIVPLAFYFLVVRRRGLSAVTLVPVLVISVVAASRVLPSGHQQPLRALEALVALAEVVLVGWISWRSARAWRKARGDAAADPLEKFTRAAFDVTRNSRVAGVLASEIAVFYYSLGSWRSRPHVPVGTSAFSHHRRSGQAAMVFAFLLIMLAEGAAAHFLLLMWSTLAAWIFTGGTIYGALWLFADYRATVLRPILVSNESVLIRAGLRWTMRIPQGQIAEIGCIKPEVGKEILNCTFLGTPTLWITLEEPMLAQGPYGFQRRVRAIGMAPDEAADLERILST